MTPAQSPPGICGPHVTSLSVSDAPSPPPPAIPPAILRAACIASLGGILFGYDLGAISLALPPLAEAFSLSPADCETVVAAVYIGGVVGAAVGGPACDYAGRKVAIMTTDVMFATSSLLLALAPNAGCVIAGRLAVGVAVSVSAIADVSYLTEISPERYRGGIVSLNEACIALGFLVAYAVGGVFRWIDSGGGYWRIMFGLAGFIAALQYFLMRDMPESPVYLVSRGRVDEAREALYQMYGCRAEHDGVDAHADARQAADSDLRSALEGRRHCLTDDLTLALPLSHTTGGSDEKDPMMISPTRYDGNSKGESGSPYSRMKTPVLPFEQPTPGSPCRKNDGNQDTNLTSSPGSVNSSISSQSPRHQPNFPHDTDDETSAPPAPLLRFNSFPLLPRLVALYKHTLLGLSITTDEIRLYRRQVVVALFLASAQQFCGHVNVLNFAPEIFARISNDGGTAGTVVLGVVKFAVTCSVIKFADHAGRRRLLLSGMASIAFGMMVLVLAFSRNSEDDVRGAAAAAALVGATAVVAGYAASFGPLTWLLTAEMFPARIRGRALGASTIVSNGCAALTSYTFLTVQERWGTAAPFVLYLAVTASSWAFAWAAVPDTRGLGPAEIQSKMESMTIWTMGGACDCCMICCCECFTSSGGGGAEAGTNSMERDGRWVTGRSNAAEGNGDQVRRGEMT